MSASCAAFTNTLLILTAITGLNKAASVELVIQTFFIPSLVNARFGVQHVPAFRFNSEAPNKHSIDSLPIPTTIQGSFLCMKSNNRFMCGIKNFFLSHLIVGICFFTPSKQYVCIHLSLGIDNLFIKKVSSFPPSCISALRSFISIQWRVSSNINILFNC